jgi:hypothetical protein
MAAGPPLPKSSAEFTVEWLNVALRDSLGPSRITSFAVELIGEGAGFVGELSRISLTYDSDAGQAPRSVIAKLPAKDPIVQGIANVFGFYEHEIRFYEEIASTIGIRTPTRYFSAVDQGAGAYVLLIEDMAPARCGDQIASCSIDEARIALSEIAKLHAAWWKSPKLRQSGWIPTLDAMGPRVLLQAMYQQGWPVFVERYGAQFPPELFELGDRFGKQFVSLGDTLAGRPLTLVHADFRLDNMFFGDEGCPFALVDWQLLQEGLAMTDVTYFVAGNFPPDVRRHHQEDLVRTYHRALVREGVLDYPFDECWEDYRRAALLLFIFVATNQDAVDLTQYNERAQLLFETIVERYTTAILDLNAAEFLPA